jgi:hypothetical protein
MRALVSSILLLSGAFNAASVAAVPPSTPATPEVGIEVIGDRPTYHCPRATSAVRIDGVLDEPDWKHVTPARSFRLSHGKGNPAGKTRLKALWDDRALYLAFECDDRDVFSPYTRRDQPIYNGEVVEAFLATGDDPRRYFEFEVSPANVLFDAKLFNPGPRDQRSFDKAWNAPGLRSAVRVDGTLTRRDDRDRGWTVEVAIPFADLGLPRPVQAGDAWWANFYRVDRGRPEEFSAWSPTLTVPPNFHVPARFGRLVFLGTPAQSDGA